MKETVSAQGVIEKQILILSEGHFMGSVGSTLVDPDTFHITGITSTEKGDTEMLALSDIVSLTGDVVIVQEEDMFVPAHGRDIRSLPLMTPMGTFLGNVKDFLFQEDGAILELLIDEGYVQDQLGRQAVLLPQDFDRLGRDVLFANNEVENLKLHAPEVGKYPAPEQVSKNEKEGPPGEELFDIMGKRISTSATEIGSRLANRVKQIDTEHMNQEVTRLTESVNRELGRFVDGIMDQFSGRRRDYSAADVLVIMKDLAGNTVSRPIYDKRGNIILMPGQHITEDKVRAVIASEKVAELYRSAVPINQ